MFGWVQNIFGIVLRKLFKWNASINCSNIFLRLTIWQMQKIICLFYQMFIRNQKVPVTWRKVVKKTLLFPTGGRGRKALWRTFADPICIFSKINFAIDSIQMLYREIFMACSLITHKNSDIIVWTAKEWPLVKWGQ